MLALGLGLGTALAVLPALLGGAGLPPLPGGWAFLTLDGNHLVLHGHYLIAEAN